VSSLALAPPEKIEPTTPVTVPAPATSPARIELAPYDYATSLALERALGISHVLAQALVRRGHSDPDAVRELLDATIAHDLAQFAGIEGAVQTIASHIAAGEPITVHGDYDVDGVCATAIMVRALRSLGATVDWFLPDRAQDGYGVSLATVERLAKRGTRLLITVDCGITAVEQVAAARAAGMSVVVSDHHAPRADGELPDCPIVHPELGGYPCAYLCGTGVAYKLASALGASTAEDDLDLVALATVADLVPLRDENRRLVREGLAALAGTAKLGLRALMEVSGTDPSALNAQALGFRLAPRINAAGRLTRADAGLELLLTEDAQRAHQIAQELDRINSERRAVEQQIGFHADAMIRELGERSAYVLAAQEWHQGVVGIVASRVVERHHRPAVLIALDRDGHGHGSGRSIPGFDLLGALNACSEHLLGYGGHRAAAGVTIDAAGVEAFRDAFEAHAASVLTPDMLEAVERVDAVASGSQLGLSLAEELERLEPCGIGNPGITLLVPGARFEDVRTMGEGKHARFSVASGGARASAVSFGCDGTVPGEGGEPLDATFRLERNVWRGAVEPRLVLRHARECAPTAIEVVGSSGDYLAAVMDVLSEPLTAQHQPPPASLRTVLDRRGEGPLPVLADLAGAAASVLAVCADVPRRQAGLAGRAGGFTLADHEALIATPSIAERFEHVVVIDPPTSAAADELIRRGNGYAHLAWGDAELRFAEQMHELEYGLRTSLVALYRGLKLTGRATGEELERLLRGDGPHGRPARLAGRLVRILAELELVSLDRDLPALAIAGEQRTALERSAAYMAYAQRHEDGLRFLSRARPRRQ
jgi:single-stranded-DNA-specific exonuclease